jgi:hypothetical protein
MVIDDKNRKKLQVLFDGVDYRKIVAERAECHPNTVTNVLLKGTDNPKVVLELFILAQEVQHQKDAEDHIRKKAVAIAKQL